MGRWYELDSTNLKRGFVERFARYIFSSKCPHKRCLIIKINDTNSMSLGQRSAKIRQYRCLADTTLVIDRKDEIMTHRRKEQTLF